MRWLGVTLLAAATGFAGIYGFAQAPATSGFTATATGCVIKGNISINTGERIFHVPGQSYYDETIITPAKGERWFCTEAEARAAGWRKAGV
jgi:hypothetical protein